MKETTPPRRAPGMGADQRRAMIVSAALPLLAQYGAALTTARIAQAAGIGEATVFRVFHDKDELLDACLAEVLKPDQVLRALAEIPRDVPITVRLTRAAEAVRAHLARLGDVVGAVHAAGPRPRRASSGPAPEGREESMRALHDAVAALFAPDREALRLGPEKAAALFVAMLFTRPLPAASGSAPTVEELVDVLLHGIVAAPGSAA